MDPSSQKIESLGMKTTKDINPLPYPAYWSSVFCLALAGLFVSLYLFYSHYRVYTDIAYQSFCAVSKSINCDTVSQSPYSIFIHLPVPLWGVFGFLMLLFLVAAAWRHADENGRCWALIFWVALLFAIVSVGLAAVSTFFIHSYCVMCIGVYLITLFTLWFAWIIRRRFSAEGLCVDTGKDVRHLWDRRRTLMPAAALMLLGFLAAIVLVPPYWQMEPPVLSQGISSGLTADGHPWLGAETPQLEVSVFSDYQCFQCRKVYMYLRQLIARYPNRLRLIHRHYPMDIDYNPLLKQQLYKGSGKMALLAIYAAGQNKFWQVNDLLYQIAGSGKDIDLNWIGSRTGLDPADLYRALFDRQIRRQLNLDIDQGLKYEIDGTPGFVIDGNVYTGTIPAEILNRLLKPHK